MKLLSAFPGKHKEEGVGGEQVERGGARGGASCGDGAGACDGMWRRMCALF